MNIAEFAEQVSTIDVICGVIAGLVVWGVISAVGLHISNRHAKQLVSDDSEISEPVGDRLKYSTMLAATKLLATMLGLASGIGVVILLP